MAFPRTMTLGRNELWDLRQTLSGHRTNCKSSSSLLLPPSPWQHMESACMSHGTKKKTLCKTPLRSRGICANHGILHHGHTHSDHSASHLWLLKRPHTNNYYTNSAHTEQNPGAPSTPLSIAEAETLRQHPKSP